MCLDLSFVCYENDSILQLQQSSELGKWVVDYILLVQLRVVSRRKDIHLSFTTLNLILQERKINLISTVLNEFYMLKNQLF